MAEQQVDEPQAEGERPEPDFPVAFINDALPHLRRPFAPNAVKFKVQTSMGPSRALLVAYIDARLVVERLNKVVGGDWEPRHEFFGERFDSGLLVCHLTVCDVTRSDVGKGQGSDTAKAAYSDSLKRAAVLFGVGVSLYAIPRFELNVTANGVEDAHGTPTLAKDKRDRPKLTAASMRWLREQYADWLSLHGEQKFGSVLDHGDSPEGSVGDPIEEGASQQDAPPEDAGLAAKRAEVDALYAEKVKGDTKLRRKFPVRQFEAQLAGAESAEQLDELAAKIEAIAEAAAA